MESQPEASASAALLLGIGVDNVFSGLACILQDGSQPTELDAIMEEWTADDLPSSGSNLLHEMLTLHDDSVRPTPPAWAGSGTGCQSGGTDGSSGAHETVPPPFARTTVYAQAPCCAADALDELYVGSFDGFGSGVSGGGGSGICGVGSGGVDGRSLAQRSVLGGSGSGTAACAGSDCVESNCKIHSNAASASAHAGVVGGGRGGGVAGMPAVAQAAATQSASASAGLSGSASAVGALAGAGGGAEGSFTGAEGSAMVGGGGGAAASVVNGGSGGGTRPRGSGGGSGGGGARQTRWHQQRRRLSALEADVAEKTAQAAAIAEANAALANRAAAIEHTVAAREKQIAILGEYKRQGDALGALPPLPRLADMTASFRAFVDRTAHLLREIDSHAPAPVPQRATGSAHAHALGAAVPRCGAGVGDGVSGAVREVSELVATFCAGMGRIFVLNPASEFEMMAMRADIDQLGPALPSMAHWQNVAHAIDATEGQLAVMSACWELNGTILTKLQAMVEACREALATAVAASGGCEPAATSAVPCATAAAATAAAAAVAPSPVHGVYVAQSRLHTALLNQAMATRSVTFVLFARVLTPLQTARALCASFPSFPNAREIILCMLGRAS